jgi:subtilisin family serine protease
MDVAQPGLLKRSPPPPRAASPPFPPPRPPPPPLPPALNVGADTCTRAISNSGLWGLDSLDRAASPMLDSSYTWAPCATGTPAHVFVIDTGIFPTHAQLSGRVSSVATCTVASGCSWSDDNGHGTHCSGTAGGLTVGVR